MSLKFPVFVKGACLILTVVEVSHLHSAGHLMNSCRMSSRLNFTTSGALFSVPDYFSKCSHFFMTSILWDSLALAFKNANLFQWSMKSIPTKTTNSIPCAKK